MVFAGRPVADATSPIFMFSSFIAASSAAAAANSVGQCRCAAFAKARLQHPRERVPGRLPIRGVEGKYSDLVCVPIANIADGQERRFADANADIRHGAAGFAEIAFE